ncbi:hypothetical protein [Tahibacter aquaticus]|uniref:hypothetical protein n=1 Tax=Tahibacter aquaticus TaxID=520092 RepID=UPI001060337E|nr:hypothetical protein [Tahibacter aquaticus]
MNKLSGFLLASVAVLAASTASASENDSNVVLTNKSAWAIHELYFSPTTSREWGQDQLGDKTIENGDTFTLNGVPCGAYDVRVVDEDGDECILEDVGLCAVKDTWVITDKDLLGCQAASKSE